MSSKSPPRPGRGALSNPEGRFESRRVEAIDDGWAKVPEAAELPPLATTVTAEHAKKIITRNDSPDIPFEQSINPYRGCEHGCVYCVWGETPILMADGTTRPIAELRAGDEIYGTRRIGRQRLYVKTRVLAHWETEKFAYRITSEEGTELIASGDHRFLTHRGWKAVANAGAGPVSTPLLTTNDEFLGLGGRTAKRGRLASVESQPASGHAGLKVGSIEPMRAPMQLFDITTGTGDFIANGVISHNCFARPLHSYVNLSPGLDFETKLFYKARAAELLDAELSRPGYVCKPINLGASTDPYQPIERKLKVTRSILEVLQRYRHPVTIVTKSSLIERDLDILTDLARENLVAAFVSITTLDSALKRGLEPRAPSPHARLHAVRTLRDAGIPVGIFVAPIIPAVNDHEIERILEAGAEAGSQTAGYVLVRLPYEVKTLFREWLDGHMPDRAAHVMSLIGATRGGRDNDPRFGTRMRGEGPYADLIARRFETACHRLGLARRRGETLSTTHFRRFPEAHGQLNLL